MDGFYDYNGRPCLNQVCLGHDSCTHILTSALELLPKQALCYYKIHQFYYDKK